MLAPGLGVHGGGLRGALHVGRGDGRAVMPLLWFLFWVAAGFVVADLVRAQEVNATLAGVYSDVICATPEYGNLVDAVGNGSERGRGSELTASGGQGLSCTLDNLRNADVARTWGSIWSVERVAQSLLLAGGSGVTVQANGLRCIATIDWPDTLRYRETNANGNCFGLHGQGGKGRQILPARYAAPSTVTAAGTSTVTDTVPPRISGWTVGAGGNDVTLTFSEAVRWYGTILAWRPRAIRVGVRRSGESSDVEGCSDAYASSVVLAMDGLTASLVLPGACGSVAQGDRLTLDYSEFGSVGLEDLSGNVMAQQDDIPGSITTGGPTDPGNGNGGGGGSGQRCYYQITPTTLSLTQCSDGVQTTSRQCTAGIDAGRTWYASAERVCFQTGSIEFPTVLSGDGDTVTAEDIDDLLDDLERLGLATGTMQDLDAGDHFKDLMTSEVRGLVTGVLARSCLGGLGGTFSNFLGAFRPWYEHLLPGRTAHAFFGGGFSVVALLPVLKAQLAQLILNISEQVRQRCHQRAIEAANQSTATSNAAILNEILDDGNVTRATAVVMTSPVLAQVAAQHASRTYSGSITEASWSTARSVDEQTQAMTAFTARLWGDDTLAEQTADAEKEERAYPWDEGLVRGDDDVCSDTAYKTQSSCEAAGETWTGDEDSAEAIWNAMKVEPDFKLPITTFADAADPARCIADVAPPTGEAAEGVVGAIRMLRSQAARGLRGAPIVKYMCTFFPDDTAADVESLCLGPDEEIGLAGWTVDASLCIYGDDAPDHWDTVWAAVRVMVTVTFGWLAVALWLPRPALAS